MNTTELQVLPKKYKSSKKTTVNNYYANKLENL